MHVMLEPVGYGANEIVASVFTIDIVRGVCPFTDSDLPCEFDINQAARSQGYTSPGSCVAAALRLVG